MSLPSPRPDVKGKPIGNKSQLMFYEHCTGRLARLVRGRQGVPLLEN